MSNVNNSVDRSKQKISNEYDGFGAVLSGDSIKQVDWEGRERINRDNWESKNVFLFVENFGRGRSSCSKNSSSSRRNRKSGNGYGQGSGIVGAVGEWDTWESKERRESKVNRAGSGSGEKNRHNDKYFSDKYPSSNFHNKNGNLKLNLTSFFLNF